MDNTDVMDALYQADRCLEQIAVKGDAAILLVAARKHLKVAYDQLKEAQSSEEVTKDA